MSAGTFDRRAPSWTPEQAQAVADFNNRTHHQFNQVRDLSLIGAYARERGWYWIAKALLPKAEVAA